MHWNFARDNAKMNIIELLLLSIGLSMDAFAVSVCQGLSTPTLKPKHMITVGVWFGFFQGAMPLLGYFLGVGFKDKISAIDHWIAFVLLGILGLKMIQQSQAKATKTGSKNCNAPTCKEAPSNFLSYKRLFPLALATSIDALAVGITFAFLQVSLLPAVSFIAIITFVMCVIGMKLGNIFGDKFKAKAELAGGIILVLIGLKILIEHLFFQ